MPRGMFWRRATLAVLGTAAVGLCGLRVAARLMMPAYMVDVREMAEQAPIVFRGRVTSVKNLGEYGGRPLSSASFEPDRVYRGQTGPEPALKFVYAPGIVHGHDCIDFQPGTYWLVFATESGGILKMTDDCIGALAVAPLTGPELNNSDWLAQMEEDFEAGLQAKDAAARILSLQRLGGLKLASSRGALHEAIERGSEEESKWAVYAALRTGDTSVLPRMKDLLAAAKAREEPETAIALELRNMTDGRAVLELLAILGSSRVELTRMCVLEALAEKIKDRRALPRFAANLNHPEVHVQWLALEGMQNTSGSGACSLPSGGSNDEGALSRQVEECQAWWEHEGKLQSWDAR